jgi:hypothetical protein
MHALDGMSAAYVPSASKGVRYASVANALEGMAAACLMGALGRVATCDIAGATKHVRSARIASTLESMAAARLMGGLGRATTCDIAGATKHVRWDCVARALEMTGAGDRSTRSACECGEIANRRKARPATARRRMPSDSLQRTATKCPFPPRRRPSERLAKSSTPEARPSVP